MRNLIRVAAAATVVGLLLQLASAAEPAPKQYKTWLQLTQTVDGEKKVLAEPVLITPDGLEAKFFTGAQVHDEAIADEIPIGVQATLTIRSLDDGRVRVEVHASYSELESEKDSNIIVSELGVRCWRTVKPGERFEAPVGAVHKLALRVEEVRGEK